MIFLTEMLDHLEVAEKWLLQGNLATFMGLRGPYRKMPEPHLI